MVGIINVTNVTMEQITGITNFTNPAEMFIYINNEVFLGWAFYLLLWLMVVILFMSAQNYRKEPLSNMLYSVGIVSVVGIFARATQAYIEGNWISMITDYQFWTFPLLTALIGALIWANKKL